ncbi:MAG: hypothetical protein AB7I30_21155, partial [Isosphaeraceae bacterium]
MVKKLDSSGSIESPIVVECGGLSLKGRALLCYCNGGQHISLSVRLASKPTGEGIEPRNDLGELISRFEEDVPREASDGRLIALCILRNILYKTLFLRPGERDLKKVPAGVLVVAGRTGSAKSRIAR